MATANSTAGASGTRLGNAASGASGGSMAAASGASAGSFAATGAVVATSGTSTGTPPGRDAGTQNGSGNTGLPCDVEQLLVTRCQSCHGSPPTLPSPMSLVTHADLMKPSLQDPSKTYAQESVIRMQGATLPMPPAPMASATAAEIAVLQNWINSGSPQGACGVTAGDGGSGDAGPGDADAACVAPVPPVMNTPVTCTSKMNWTGGNNVGMRPGESCGNCHGCKYSIVGTVYPTAHEKDDCYGVNGSRGVTVVITDKTHTVTLTPNNVGTFTFAGTLTLPYQAKVIQNGKTRTMMTPQTNGDCNSCHSEMGDNCAPGRILIP